MKTKTIIVMLSVMLLFTLSTFGRGKDEAQTASTEIATVRLMTDETDAESQKWIKARCEWFEKENPGIKVTPTFFKWESTDAKIATEIASGSPSDVIVMGMERLVRLSRKGMLIAVTDVIEETGGKGDYFEALMYSTGGEIHWVPYATSTDLMWWRTDLLKGQGLSFPAKWDEFLVAIEKLTQDQNGDGLVDIYGHGTSYGTSNAAFTHMAQAAWSNEAYMFDAQHRVVLDKSPNRERFIEALKYRKKVRPFVPPGAPTYEYKDLLQGFYSGKLASTVYGPRILSQVHQYGPELAPVTEGYTMPYNRKIHQMIFPDGWSIPKGAKNPQVAKKLIKALVSGPEYIDFLHTVPLHLSPPRKSLANSPEYMDHPIIKAHPQTTKLYYEMLAIAKPKVGPWGEVNPVLTEFYGSKELQHIVAKYILEDSSPEAVVDELVKRLKELHAEVMK